MHAHHASFLPQILIRHARSGLLETGDGAFSLLRPGVLLFTDVSGFTALTERFAAGNAMAGAEQLTDLLNQYFDPLIRTIHAYGGDIIKFAGDAMLILWVDEDGLSLKRYAEGAIACAHELQALMQDCAQRRGESLSMKAAVSVGDIRQVCLGGVLGRRDMLLTGAALSELGRANDHAKPGDVIVCASAVKAIGEVSGSKLVPDASPNDHEAALAMLSDVAPVHARLPAEHPSRHRAALENPGVTNEAADILRTFIPAAIRKALDANQAEWVSENRLVSLLFVNLRDFSDELPVDFEQTAMRAIQTALYRFEGSLNKISVDDKGVSLLGAFGMPPFRHSDDPLRAVRAALAIHAALSNLGLSCAIGVTTGRVFCGVVGNGLRREYTVMGDVVNLSARLMGNALKRKTGLPIMVDESTWLATRDKLPFGEVELLKLKGKANPVPAYQPLEAGTPALYAGGGAGAATTDGKGNKGSHTRQLLGRQSELDVIAQSAKTVLQTNRSLLIDIAAPVGSGRRHLCRTALESVAREGFIVWRLSCSAMQQYSPWQALAPIFRGLLPQRNPDESTESWRNRILAELPPAEGWRDKAALLEAVLPAQWVDSPVTAALSGEARANATADYLCKLLLLRLGTQPVCIRIRDVEWMDRASVDLCQRILLHAEHVLILGMRDSEFAQSGFWPDAAQWNPGQYRLLGLPPLPADLLLQLAKEHLGFDNPPRDSLRLIDERANGSPLHAIQILSAVQQAGDQFNIDELPSSIEGLIISRIDRLPPETSLTGKILSVAIFDMDVSMLTQMHPSLPHADDLATRCSTLAQQGFVKMESFDAKASRGVIQFAHASAQQTFYSLIPVVQRRSLHQRMATKLESAQSAAGEQLDHCSYHWLRACETTFGATQQELETCVLSACQTLLSQARRNTRLGALPEAEQQFEHAISLGAQHKLGVTREVEIDALLGLSSVRFSRYGWADEQAANALEKARELSEGSARRLPVFSAVRGLWQICVGRSDYARSLQLAREMLEFAESTDKEDAARDAMRAEAHRALGTTFFWLGRFDQAESYLRKTLEIPVDTLTEGLNLTQDTRVSSLGMLAWACAIQGKTEQTLQTAENAVAEAVSRGSSFSLAYVHGTAMWACLHVSDIEKASYHAGETLRISQDKGFEYLATAARVVFGWAKAWQGDAAGIDEIAVAVERWRAKGQSIGVPAFLLQWVRALRKHGRMVEAQALLDSDAFVAGLKTEPWISLLTQRMLAE